MNEEKKLFMVYFNGFRYAYGIECYVLGIYDDIEKAMEAKKSAEDECGFVFSIVETKLNETLSIDHTNKFEHSTDLLLCGYAEVLE